MVSAHNFVDFQKIFLHCLASDMALDMTTPSSTEAVITLLFPILTTTSTTTREARIVSFFALLRNLDLKRRRLLMHANLRLLGVGKNIPF